MEPSTTTHWSDTTFVVNAKITFSLSKKCVRKVSPSELLAAVVLADRENPWWDSDRAARLSISEPELFLDDADVSVYHVRFQSPCIFVCSQLPAYVKYVNKLVRNAPRFIANREVLLWTQCVVDFQGTSPLIHDEHTAVV